VTKTVFALVSVLMLLATVLSGCALEQMGARKNGESPIEVFPLADAWPDCRWGCTAEDVRAERIWLGDVSGDPLGECTAGDPVSAYIWFEFYNNANSPRRALIVIGDIYIDEVLDTSLDECVLDSLDAKATRQVAVYSFSWVCGSVVEIRNLVLSWETAGGTTCATAGRTCGTRKAKCYASLAVVLEAPIIVDFEFDEVCFCNNTTFIDKTTGGATPYTWDWDFGDGSDSDVQDPTHHYASASTFNVTLTVTDSDSPPDSSSQNYHVTINPRPAADAGADEDIVAGNSVEIGGSPTATGGTPGYTYSWAPATGLDDDSVANPTASPTSTTTYIVTLTDSEGCTDSDEAEVRVAAICDCCICGFVYVAGTTEGLAGWEVILEKSVNPWVEAERTTTDADGKYCFCGLGDGEYRVSEAVEPGWNQISPLPNEHILVLPGDASDPEDGPFHNFENEQTFGSSAPPLTVGWEACRLDKSAVLAPWIALFMAIIAAASLLLLRRRRGRS